jgi:hypothetical protein
MIWKVMASSRIKIHNLLVRLFDFIDMARRSSDHEDRLGRLRTCVEDYECDYMI